MNMQDSSDRNREDHSNNRPAQGIFPVDWIKEDFERYKRWNRRSRQALAFLFEFGGPGDLHVFSCSQILGFQFIPKINFLPPYRIPTAEFPLKI
jgi:hypothetical protein